MNPPILIGLRLVRYRPSVPRLVALAVAAAAVAGVLQVPPARLLPTAAPFTTAVLFVGAIWFSSAVGLLGLWLISSLDRFFELAGSAARAALPAVWIAPGVFLVAVGTPLTTPTGFALIVAGVWLTFSSRTPRKRRLTSHDAKVGRVRASLLTAARVPAGFLSAESVPLAAAAITAHLAVAALVARLPLLAASLAALAAGLAALAPGSRRTAPPTGRTMAAVTVVAAVLLAVLPLRTPNTSPDQSFLTSLMHAPPPEVKRAQPKATPLVPLPPGLSGKDLVPGIVLKPNAKRDGERTREAVLSSMHPGPILTVTKPLTLQFTGEYELFPESNGGVTDEASILRGTPLDAVYGTSAAGALATHAVQRFRPWLDCGRCGRLQLTLIHGNKSPGLAKAFIQSDQGAQEVGSDLYGWTAATEETISIDVPPEARRSRVFALRIAFHPMDPSEQSKSVRVAIKSIVWEPASSE